MNKKSYFKIEYLVYFYILLIPIFDFIFNQYMNNLSYNLVIKLSLVKLIIPLFLYLYVLIKLKGKERTQFFLLTLVYIIYSLIIGYIYYKQFINKQLDTKIILDKSLQIYNLFIFILSFFTFYKLFYRKNTIKLRMIYNHVAAIYLISILLLSLTLQAEPIWHNNLSLTILMLLFIALVSLRYREDRTYSFILFIVLLGYYISTIKNKTAYYGILTIVIIYFISLIVEKYIKNELTISDVYKIIRGKLIEFLYRIINFNKIKVKRLTSPEKLFLKKKIKGYTDKRIYKYDDLNRRKKFKTKRSIKKFFYNLELKKALTKENRTGIKEVKARLKQKKKEKRENKIDLVLNSKFVKVLFTIILIFISLFIIYITHKLAKTNVIFNFLIKDNYIYIIYFIPIVYILIKIVYFFVFKFKNVDSEFIILTFSVIYIIFLFLMTKELILDFTISIMLSSILVMLINKIHLGKTNRDIKILKEQIEYKKSLKPKKRLVFGITSLNISGVSRILVDICNGLSKKYPNLDVEIFTLFAGGEFEEGVNVKIISLFKKPFNSYSKLNKFLISTYIKFFEPNIFNKYIRGNYDTVIAFDEGNITSLFSYTDEAKKIAWIHNKNYNIYSKLNKTFKNKIINVYIRYDKLIFAREVGLRKFNKTFINKKIKRVPKDIITNYVDPLRIYIKSEEESVYEWTKDTISLLSVVRLYKHKALDRFIRVHKRVLNDGLSHKIYIIGDGPEMENLKKLIRKEKLQTTVFLLGSKLNPYPYIKNATYFCLFSEREEYSIVLNEAKILNKDILITDTRTRDIVQDYPNVRIFDNSESGIYTGLRYVLSNSKKDKTNFEYIYKNDEILKEIYSLLY